MLIINKVSNVIEISQDGGLPRCYFGVSGKFYPSGKDENLEIDGFLINMEKDTYNVKWYDLLINDTSPTDLANAALLLSQVFGITFPPAPPIPPINPLLKVNPPSVNTFDIPEWITGNDGNFTIEWLQYMYTDTNFPRLYSIGQYPAQNAVSVEGGVLYLWLNGSIQGTYDLSLLSGGYIDVWVNVVVERYKDFIRVWLQPFGQYPAQNVIEISNTAAIPTLGNDLYIGSENAPNTYYNGLISNFRFTINYAVNGGGVPDYPMNALLPVTGTVLLIGVGGDLPKQLTDQAEINTITASNLTYNIDSGIASVEGSIQFGTI